MSRTAVVFAAALALGACRESLGWYSPIDGESGVPDAVVVDDADVHADGDVMDATDAPDVVDAQPPPAVLHLTLGARHTCALLDGGSIDCWGNNDHGQLGDGTTTERSTPTPVSGVSGAVAVMAGASHTCAVVTDGGVLCWGANGNGQLGDSTTTDRSTPTVVQGLAQPVAQLSLGATHTCARTTTYQVWCWGANDHGQLGRGALGVPINVAPAMAMTGGTYLTGGDDHVCVRQGNTTDGFYSRCWGANSSGQLGDGTTTDRGTPAVTMTTIDVARGGGRHACGLHPTSASSGMAVVGNFVCWGANDAGQLGDATTMETHAPTAYPMLGPGQLITSGQLALGGDHTCVAGLDGSLHCWGRNDSGEIGDGTTSSHSSPTFVGGLPGIAEVALGAHHTCALSTAGRVFCWGANDVGQLGDGTLVQRTQPVAVTW